MLSLFVDALSYSYLKEHFIGDMPNVQVAPMIQNVGYSSSLHWELYNNIYPDDHGYFVDWVKENESNKLICLISDMLAFTDYFGNLGVYLRKVLNRYIFRKNLFANIPFRFRKYFSCKSDYLFWDKKNYGRYKLFDSYVFAMQDEGKKSFDENLALLKQHVENGEKNIFGVFGEVDAIGHTLPRGSEYDAKVDSCMRKLFQVIDLYRTKQPDKSILIVSDHGMSTINNLVDVDLEKKFGRASKKTYIAYSDTAIMCVFCETLSLKEQMEDYLSQFEYGHVLSDEERKLYGISDKKFGDIIFNLKEGYGFADNWFGKSIRRNYNFHVGMHGFWPEWTSKDQLASVVLINGKEKLAERYNYRSACELINEVMKDE